MEGFTGVATAELPAEPRPGTPCRICSTPLPESLRCSQCGAAYGEAHRCPHCRTITGVEAHPTLKFRCRVCGGPRVPTNDAKVVRSGRERSILARARKDQLKSGLYKGAGIVSAATAAVALFSVLFLIAVTTPGVLASLALVLLASMPALFAAFALKRGKMHAKEIEQHLNQAWLVTASDVLATKGTVQASELAEIMQISESQAELLLAELSVQDFIHARVSDDGALSYLAPARVRIAAAGGRDLLEPAEHEPSHTEASTELSPNTRATLPKQ